MWGSYPYPAWGRPDHWFQPCMLSGLVYGVSTQGGDQVQQLRRVWEPQIEGVVAPITSLCAALGR